MATRTARLIQDQNLSIHYDGGASIGGKFNVAKTNNKGTSIGGKPNLAKAQNNGGIGTRKALQDLSNSTKPCEIPLSMKKNSVNVLKGNEKTQVSGRKPLSDVTNSVNRPKKIPGDNKKNKKPMFTVAEEEENFPKDIAGERFLHNHQECIKAQTKSLDMKSFLKTVGLDEDIFTPLASSQGLTSSSKVVTEMEEEIVVPELMNEEYYGWKNKSEPTSPICGSLKFPNILEDQYDCPSFVLMDSP